MGYEYSYVMEEALGAGIASGIVSSMPSFALSIAMYVLKALALYAIAQRRGIGKPWLAWIPVADVWLIGSISDQYRYVVKGENKSKRKTLLILNIICAVLYVVMMVFMILFFAQVFGNLSQLEKGLDDHAFLIRVMKPMIGMLSVLMVYMGVAIATAIVRYVAMYDVYNSLDPANCVAFLVLSILFGVTEPFFLFFNRNKDLGMPPRKAEPVYMPPVEPWEANNQEF